MTQAKTKVFSDNVILSEIRQNRRLDRKFHNLNLDARREVIRQVAGCADEKCLLKAIRRVKRVFRVAAAGGAA